MYNNLNYLAIIDNRKEGSLLSCILSYFLILLLVYRIDGIEPWEHIITGLSISLYTLLIFSNTIPVSEKIHKLILLFYIGCMGILVLSSFETVFLILLSITYVFDWGTILILNTIITSNNIPIIIKYIDISINLLSNY